MISIKNYESKYSVTSSGQVWSHIRNKFLKPDLRGKYYAVKLGKFGEKKSIHRLVAEAFIPNPKDKPFVNHKDGNKLNNDSGNLEWCTAKENTFHAQQTGLMKIKTFPIIKRQKISDPDHIVCEKFLNGDSAIKLAKEYGVTRGAIYAVLNKNKVKKRSYIV